MTTSAERQAADLSHNGDTYQRDTVTTADGELCAVPAAWAGKFVEFTAWGQDVYIRFGADANVDVNFTTASARDGGTFALTATTKGPHLIIPAGQSRHERIDSSWTHFAHISPTTGGRLFAVLATGDGQ